MIPVFGNIRKMRLTRKSGVGLDVQAINYICKIVIQGLCN